MSQSLVELDKTQQIMYKVLGLYGCVPQSPPVVAKGYRNLSFACKTNSGWVNLIIYKDEPGIKQTIRQANSIGDFLSNHGYPARHSLDGRVLLLKSSNSSRLACLYNYLPGNTIPWEAYTRRHIRQLGLKMAEMHQILDAYSSAELPIASRQMTNQLEIMVNYFASANVKKAMSDKLKLILNTDVLSQLQSVIEQTSNWPIQIPLHLDFVRGNILFSGVNGRPSLSGVIDFEKSAVGSPLIDIARTLAFLMVDCKYQAPADINRNFLYHGYQACLNNFLDKQAEISREIFNQRLTELINYFLIHDMYKFLKHNPYESLQANQHYLRTVKLAVHKGLLHRSRSSA